jgi:hypothetical protein
MKFFFICTILSLIIFNSELLSQVDTTKSTLLVITLSDGSEHVGQIESAESKFLNFLTRENKIIRISKSEIKDVVAYEDSRLAREEKAALRMKETGQDTIVRPEYTDANLNRMIIFPTARPMKPWQWYIQLNELFFPFAAVGIGNFLTLGGGISLLPTMPEQIIYLSPKITPLHSENLSLAAGVFFVTSTHKVEITEGMGVAYTMATIGDKERSFSVGLGWGFSGENFSNKPIVILGGDIKIGRNLKLIAETWTPFIEGSILGIIGFRIIGKHISGDFVVMRPFGQNTRGGSFVPWFNLTYNFGYE